MCFFKAIPPSGSDAFQHVTAWDFTGLSMYFLDCLFMSQASWYCTRAQMFK